MAIKKPITKRSAQADPDEDEDDAPVVKKSLKKKASEPEPEEEEEAESEPEEEEKPAKKSSKLKKKVSKKSFAQLFDDTKPGRTVFPLGDFKMVLTEFELLGDIAEEDEDQGELKAKVTFTGHDDEDEVAGKSISNFYNLCDEDGEPGPGIPFLKDDLDVLGYEDVTIEDLQEIFDDINAENPEVIVKVKLNTQGYTNAYLQGLAEGE